MLSVRDLTKSYKTKGGVVTKALDGVSIDFPERGMVFILGKSGSGKSTLLNVTGGLDRPDSGEIIVKGKSSKDFSASDFDSYRNTFIGFIFQEYNILNEFNVEQNIALALQLQGKKNDKAAVNALLEKVDLIGYGHRKPNTLSGGQKQRVAIARALIKDPEIIMADEPTGALDSKTGKDVMDTLKKLSEEKLVIIVSHDLDFAEQYGDRIVEMKDGKIISDVTKNYAVARDLSANVSVIANDTLRVRGGTRLSDAELENIRTLIEQAPAGSETIISSDEKKVENFKRSNNITADGRSEYFADTRPSDIEARQYDGKSTRFIKSRLPFGHALRMGASGLKTKPVRLILTIFISLLAFGMFGVLSTMMMYDMNYSVATALEGQDYHTFMLRKNYDAVNKYTYVDYYGGEKNENVSEDEREMTAVFTADEIEKYNNDGYGLDYAGCLIPSIYSSIEFDNVSYSGSDQYYSTMPSGYTDVSEEFMKRNFGDGYILCGEAPQAADEVAISEYTYNVIVARGGIDRWEEYIDGEPHVYPEFKPQEGMQGIDENILGKTLLVRDNYGGGISDTLTITGVYDTGEVPQKFDSLKENSGSIGGGMNQDSYDMQSEMRTTFHCMMYVAPEFIDSHSALLDYETGYSNNSVYVEMSYSYIYRYLDGGYSNNMQAALPEMMNGSDIRAYSTKGEDITPTAMDGLKKGEVLIPMDSLSSMVDSLLNSAVEVDQEGGWITKSYRETLTEDVLNKFDKVLNYGYEDPSEEDIKFVIGKVFEDWNDYVLSDINISYVEEYNNRQLLPIDKLYLGSDANESSSTLKVVGVYEDKSSMHYGSGSYIMTTETLDMLGEMGANYNYGLSEYISDYVRPANARYNAIVTNLENNTYEALMYMLSSGNGSDGTYFVMEGNEVYNNASSSAMMFDDMSFVFTIIGAVLAAISALLLFNYISVSIADKRKEIGILRAVGARGSDVFKIFISESLMIALICGVLAIVAAAVVCFVINTVTVSSAIAIQLLNFGFINGLIVMGIALAVAFIGTILPVYFAARKVPVESIRAL